MAIRHGCIKFRSMPIMGSDLQLSLPLLDHNIPVSVT